MHRFTPDVAARIIGARRVGASLRKAARAAGCSWSAFLQWQRRGRAWYRWEDGVSDEQPPAHYEQYAQFARDIDRADSQFDIALHTWVAKGAQDDPRLAFDILKRRDGFKLQQRAAQAELELTQARTAALRGLGLSGLSDEELALIQTIMTQAARRNGTEHTRSGDGGTGEAKQSDPNDDIPR